MNWFIVPVLRYYHYSGHLLPRLRLKESICINGVWYGIMILVAVGGFFYLYAKKQLNVQDIEVLVIALSNCIGLMLVYMFMAPGLVDLPRKFWRRRNLRLEQE